MLCYFLIKSSLSTLPVYPMAYKHYVCASICMWHFMLYWVMTLWKDWWLTQTCPTCIGPHLFGLLLLLSATANIWRRYRDEWNRTWTPFRRAKSLEERSSTCISFYCVCWCARGSLPNQIQQQMVLEWTCLNGSAESQERKMYSLRDCLFSALII